MANSNEIIKELFIKLGLTGAKEIKAEIDKIIDSMQKMEKSTEDVGDQLDQTTEETKKSTSALQNMGQRINNLIGDRFKPFLELLKKITKSFGGFVTVVRNGAAAIGRALSVLLAPLRLVGRAFAPIFASGRRIFEFAAGSLLADGIRNIADALRDLATRTIDATISEEKAVYALRRGLYIRQQYGRALEKQFTDLAGSIQKELGIDADLILTGIGRSLAAGIEPRDIPRVTRQAATLSEIFGTNILEIFNQFQQALLTGQIPETLSRAVPELRKLNRTAEGLLDQNEVLSTIDQKLSKIGGFVDTSLSKELERLNVAFSEFLKTAGRPIAGVLKYIAQKLTPILNLFASRNLLSRFGDAIGRAIATLFKFFPLDPEQLEQRLKVYFDILARGINFLSVFLEDFFKYLLGAPSLLAKYVTGAGFEATLLGLAQWLLQRFIDAIGQAIAKSNIFSSLFKGLVFGSTGPLIPPETAKKFDESMRSRGSFQFWDKILPFFNGKKSTNEIYNNGSSVPPQGSVYSPSNSVVFNNNINISTQSPVDAIKRQLQSQGLLASNMGRRS